MKNLNQLRLQTLNMRLYAFVWKKLHLNNVIKIFTNCKVDLYKNRYENPTLRVPQEPNPVQTIYN